MHPDICATLPPRARVADIGTGTAIFLRNLRASYPDATLDGYDISAALYPPPETDGIRLHVLDIKQPVPQELRATYDLVHVRLLAAAMLPSEWRAVVDNVSQLLKPGGWLQWEECDFSSSKHLRGSGDSRVDTARRMGNIFRDALIDRFHHGWRTLPDDFLAAGLRSVVSDLVSSDRLPETRQRMTSNGMKAVFNWARLTAARNSPGAMSVDEIDRAERAAYQDIESGCYVRFDVYIVCGRKPPAE